MRSILVCLVVGLITVSAVAAGPPASDAQITKLLEEFLSSAEKEGFRGAVLVARGGKVLLEQAYGVADPTRGTPITTDSVFTVGSITKQFTAAAILLLEDDGKLSVDHPITRYFSDVPPDKRGITLHHLLTHTAGFPGALGDDRERIDREAYIRRALDAELLFEPGSRYEYSNVGFSLLAAIIEQLSEANYEVFLRERLFDPAKMKDTGYVLPKWKSERLAHGFGDDGSDWGTLVANVITDEGPGWNLVGNGGIHSTTGDIYRWHCALSGEAILSAASKKKMYTRHADEGGSWYGYGWSIQESPFGELITHDGGNPYYFADFLRYPETDTVIYYSTTSRDRRMTRLARRLAEIVFTGEMAELPVSRTMIMSKQGPPAAAGSPAARWGLPGSFRGNRAGELLDAIVTDDAAARRAFVDQGFSPGCIERNGKSGLLSVLESLRGEIGEFRVRGAGPNGESGVTIVIDSEAHDAPMQLIVTLEPDEPHRIETIGVEIGD